MRRNEWLSCDDKVKNAENLQVMFLISREIFKCTKPYKDTRNRVISKDMRIISKRTKFDNLIHLNIGLIIIKWKVDCLAEVSRAHGCISVVRLGDKKCKIIGGGWGRVKNLKPGLINNGTFYQQYILCWETWLSNISVSPSLLLIYIVVIYHLAFSP